MNCAASTNEPASTWCEPVAAPGPSGSASRAAVDSPRHILARHAPLKDAEVALIDVLVEVEIRARTGRLERSRARRPGAAGDEAKEVGRVHVAVPIEVAGDGQHAAVVAHGRPAKRVRAGVA